MASTAGRRLTTITIDQGISSASNVLITILAARVLDTASFGLFGVVFITYATIQGLSRALVGEPLLVRPQESQERPGEAVGTALLLGLGLSVVVLVGAGIAYLADPGLGRALLVLGMCAPLLLMQDLGRYLAFASHKPTRALVLDVGWLSMQLVAVTVLAITGADTLAWFIVAWAGSGAIASLLVVTHIRGHHVRLGLGWLRETWPFSWRYASSFGATQLAQLGVAVVIAGILGARDLGAVRGVLLLYGPLSQLQTAVGAAGITEIARRTIVDGVAVDSPEIRRHVGRTTALTTSAAILNVAILLLLPDELGRVVLADTWEATQHLLLPAGLQAILITVTSGPRALLVGVRAVRKTLTIDIVATIVMFTSTTVGALTGDVETAFWFLAASQGVMALVWWMTAIGHVRGGGGVGVVTPRSVQGIEGGGLPT